MVATNQWRVRGVNGHGRTILPCRHKLAQVQQGRKLRAPHALCFILACNFVFRLFYYMEKYYICIYLNALCLLKPNTTPPTTQWQCDDWCFKVSPWELNLWPTTRDCNCERSCFAFSDVAESAKSTSQPLPIATNPFHSPTTFGQTTINKPSNT